MNVGINNNKRENNPKKIISTNFGINPHLISIEITMQMMMFQNQIEKREKNETDLKYKNVKNLIFIFKVIF